MKKATEFGNDFYLVLLEWRNTPSEGMEISPSQPIFSRRVKTLLPISKKLLNQRLPLVSKKNFERGKRYNQSIITEAQGS